MKPQPRLQDMPSLIKQRITDKLDFYVDKMSLRTACPNFRPIIGNPKTRSIVAICEFEDTIQMSLIIDHHLKQTRNYVKTDKGCKVIIRHQLKWTFVEREIEEQKAKDREIVLENEDYLEVARRDFEMISDNPNLSIDHLTLDKQSDKENLVDLIKYKLKVKGFGIQGFKEGELLRIFSYLDSEVLETFRMEEAPEMDLFPILKTWKNLKKLELVDAPMELWWDYPDTEIKSKKLKKEDLKRILEHFHAPELAPDFQKSKIYTKISDKDIMDTLGATFHQSNGYQCAQLITDKRTIYLYVKKGIVQFASQPIGYRESYDDEDWELDD